MKQTMTTETKVKLHKWQNSDSYFPPMNVQYSRDAESGLITYPVLSFIMGKLNILSKKLDSKK